MNSLASCLRPLCLVLVCGCGGDAPQAAPPEDAPPAPATDEEIRREVSEGGVGLALPIDGPYAMVEIVVVPPGVEAAYRQRPGEVVALLLGVAERGRPRESIKALAFALALVEDLRAPVPAVRLFEAGTYDQPDPHWGPTPRQYWLGILRRQVAAKRKT